MRAVATRTGAPWRVLGVEVAEGMRAILREPTALFFSVLMPVGFFALFASIAGTAPAASPIPAAASMLATYGAFGVVSVMLVNPGVSVAEDRTRGWLRVKKVSAAPIGTTIAAKVLSALPYAVASVLAMSAVSLLVAGPTTDPGTWLRLLAVLLLGALPFALVGLAVGFVASSNAAVAVLNALLFPMVIASGLWFPLEILPDFVQHLAPFGLVVFPLNYGACVLFIYAAGFAGTHWSRRAAVGAMAGLDALVLVLAAVSPLPFPDRLLAFGPPLVFVWVVGFSCMGEALRERESAGLRVANARIQHLATLSERERISRDLHDLLGQSLTGIVVRSQLAQRLTRTDPAAGTAEMAEVERVARAALSEVRATVSGWRQVLLDDEIVVARDALTAAGVQLTVARDPDLVLTPSAETALSMALREAVTNVVRHAHARSCTVALRRVDGAVVLEVVDDGIGGSAREGNGLTGMRERIAALGGDVQRLARDGTAVTVAVPAAVAT